MLKKEDNIIFEIYNKDDILVKEVKTNEEGEVEFELPYGTYTVKIKIHDSTGKATYFRLDLWADRN